MKKQIVIINGTGGSGKDTFVDFVSKYKKVKNFSSIDKVKEIAKLIGWSGTKTEKDRKFLSDLKSLTTSYNDMAFKDTLRAVQEFLNGEEEIMFIHIRETEEILRTKNEIQAKTLLIKREGLDNIASNRSDRDVEKYNYDYIILNDTLENLEKKAYLFAQNIGTDQLERVLKKDSVN